MKKVQATNEELRRLYPETILAAARPLAARMGCPCTARWWGRTATAAPSAAWSWTSR